MNKQKELSDLLYTVYCSDAADGGNEFDEMAKAIIAKYPQILAKKIYSGDYESVKIAEHLINNYYTENKIELFIREVK